MAIAWNPKMKDFDTIRKWGMEDDPMVAVNHFNPEQVENRWSNKHNVCEHENYGSSSFHMDFRISVTGLAIRKIIIINVPVLLYPFALALAA